MTKEPKVSIVIPTYNHCDDLLKPCIESIIRNTDLSDMEIIISANGCTDNTKEYIESLGEPFKLVWNDNPLGYTKATNEGIKESKGQYVLLLNNDVIILDFAPKHMWIGMLLEPFEKDDRMGITGPLLDYNSDSGMKFAIFFMALIKKELFNRLGLLDEIFSPGAGEDTDFCIKAQLAGYKMAEVPNTERKKSDGLIMIGDFPVYHKGEGTMHDENVEWEKMAVEDNWTDIFDRNTQLLKERYSSPSNVKYDHILHSVKPGIYNEIVNQNEYKITSEDVLNKVVVDIGANVGVFTALVASLGASKVISVEPVPDNLIHLRDTVKRYSKVSDIQLIEKCIFWNSGKFVNISNDGERSSQIPSGEVLAETISFTDIVKGITDTESVLKVDCEGCEYSLFYGTPVEIIRKFKTIYIELHGSTTCDYCGNIDNLKLFITEILGYDKVRDEHPMYYWANNKLQKTVDVGMYKFIRK